MIPSELHSTDLQEMQRTIQRLRNLAVPGNNGWLNFFGNDPVDVDVATDAVASNSASWTVAAPLGLFCAEGGRLLVCLCANAGAALVGNMSLSLRVTSPLGIVTNAQPAITVPPNHPTAVCRAWVIDLEVGESLLQVAAYHDTTQTIPTPQRDLQLICIGNAERVS